jgi:dipeptidyl aminopeptidase/acylaminoacyl peptidase
MSRSLVAIHFMFLCDYRTALRGNRKNGSALRLLLVAAGLFAALSAPAADTPWTVDALMRIKTVGDPQISPDGARIAYVVRSANFERNAYDSEIWMAPADGGRPQRITQPHASDDQPRWSRDGRLAFVSRRNGAAQIYVLQKNAGARQLTSSPTAVTSFKWSPDNGSIAYLAADPIPADEQALLRRGSDAVVADRVNRYARIYVTRVTDLPAGPGRLLTRADRHVLSFDWSPDGARIVYAGQATPRNRDAFNVDLHEIDVATGRDSALVEQPGRDGNPSYSPDGRLVAFHSQAGTNNYFEARHIGIARSGGSAVRYVTEKLDIDVFRGGNEFSWSRDGRQLIFGGGKGTHDELVALDLEALTLTRLVTAVAGPSSFSASGDGQRIAFLRASPTAPPEVWLLDRRQVKPEERQISRVNPQISEYSSFQTRTLGWKSKDGLQIEGVLRLPVGYGSGARVPLLVELHGGPTGVALEDYPVPRTYPTQLYLQAGFAVLAPNFRGSSNYGASLRLANIQSQGFGDMDDVMAGIDHLVAQGIADPDRLGVMGWSYGGFLSIWIVSHSQRFKAASIGAPTTDWISWYGESDGAKEVLWTYFGGKPWDNWQTYNRHSPRYSLIDVKTPSLLLHGEKDIDSTPEIFYALTDLQVPVEFVTYPREGHGFGEPWHQRDLLERNLGWFQRWIGGADPLFRRSSGK